MAESKRFEREPAEGSRSTVEKQLKDQKHSSGEGREKMREPEEADRKQAEQD